jgi:hypothetical protein
MIFNDVLMILIFKIYNIYQKVNHHVLILKEVSLIYLLNLIHNKILHIIIEAMDLLDLIYIHHCIFYELIIQIYPAFYYHHLVKLILDMLHYHIFVDEFHNILKILY